MRRKPTPLQSVTSSKESIMMSPIDAFDDILKPPEGESAEAKQARLALEEEARKRSRAIDEAIRLERIARKKQKVVKLLLLGQSESGKSTTVKHFQRMYTPTAFNAERIQWRQIIQLNIVRSLRILLDVLQGDQQLSEETRAIATILNSPIRAIEKKLIKCLVSPNEDEPTHFENNGKEIWIPAGADAQRPLEVITTRSRSNSRVQQSCPKDNIHEEETAQDVLSKYRAAISALWDNVQVQALLHTRGVRLKEHSGFFLDEIDRVTSAYYLPTDADILRARLKTVGVSEYRFEMNLITGAENDTLWRIIDVGGAKSQRAAWAPFFDDVDLIIFLAPLNVFDVTLAEDRNQNRLEDSVKLWKSICSNKVLAKVPLMLFLNKCDLLSYKLDAGVKLNRYVKSFADRPNNSEAAVQYFRGKFSAINREYSPEQRKLYVYNTTVTDIASTSKILESVREVVLRQSIAAARLV